MTTRHDVAQEAGVSPAVVSYVLNNGPRPVSTVTRARVEAAIKRLNYTPNVIASALRGGASRSIGLLVPDSLNVYYSELAEAIERVANDSGYLVLSGYGHGDRSRELRILETFMARRVDGLVLTSDISVTGERFTSDRPTVMVGAVDPPPEVSAVCATDVADARMAIRHLQFHGHELIGCIVNASDRVSAETFLRGWREQHKAAGTPYGEELVAYADASEEGGTAAAAQLLSTHGRPWTSHGRHPTALFVSSDMQAIGVISACWEMGLSVPEDIAVVAIGGSRLARYTIPPLTTVRRDVAYMANVAGGWLIRKISDSSVTDLRTEVGGNLVIGRSCGCGV